MILEIRGKGNRKKGRWREKQKLLAYDYKAEKEGDRHLGLSVFIAVVSTQI